MRGRINTSCSLRLATFPLSGSVLARQLCSDCGSDLRRVFVKRFGNAIVLLPKTGDRWAGLFAALDEFPRDFTLERRQDQPLRAGLDDLFNEAND